MQAAILRTFFAIDLAKEAKEQLADYSRALKKRVERQYQQKHFRWVKLDNLHITLQFLARVNEGDLARLITAVSAEVKSFSSFVMQLGPLEWFPNSHNPHVLSLQTQPHERLAELSFRIGKGIVNAGYPIEDRQFRGHLTLARVAYLRDVDKDTLNSFDLPPLPAVQIKEIILFRSEPEHGGSIYTKLSGIDIFP